MRKCISTCCFYNMNKQNGISISLSAMKYRSLIILAMLTNACHRIDAKLNFIPRNTEVMINDSTYLNCSTSLLANQVQWRHGSNYVYTGLAILEPYNDRFSVEINASTGACNLVIRSVKPSDVGTYECAEDEGIGDRGSAQLIVLGGDPVCKSNTNSDGVIGPNSCGIEAEEVKLSCSIKYHGDSLPVLEWKASGDNQSITDGLFNATSSANKVTYTLTMKSTLGLSNSSFICQTTNLSDKHYSCSSGAINVLYVFSNTVTVNLTMNEEVSCVANSSQSCSYKWKWLSGDDSTTESDNRILKPNKGGMHRCEATCSLRNKSCSVRSLHAMVHLKEATSGQDRMSLLALLLVPSFAVIGVSMWCWSFYRKRKLQKGEREEEKRAVEERQRLHDAPGQEKELGPEEEEKQGLQGYVSKSSEKRELVKKITFGHNIWGLAILNKELFVSSINEVSIFVYDTVAFEMLRTFDLETSRGPRDIAAYQKENCLFAVDELSGSSLFRIDEDGNVLDKWEVPYEPHNLSVMPSGNILLTCSARILIYNYSDGVIITDLKLDEDALDMSWHTLALRSGDYLVCQGWKNSKHHRVLTLNTEGEILKSFGSEKKHSDSHLADPVYMTVRRDGEIIVADSGNNRVVLLSQELVFRRELLNKEDGVIEPYRVLLDEDSRLLYVGTNHRQLFLFKFFQ